MVRMLGRCCCLVPNRMTVPHLSMRHQDMVDITMVVSLMALCHQRHSFVVVIVPSGRWWWWWGCGCTLVSVGGTQTVEQWGVKTKQRAVMPTQLLPKRVQERLYSPKQRAVMPTTFIKYKVEWVITETHLSRCPRGCKNDWGKKRRKKSYVMGEDMLVNSDNMWWLNKRPLKRWSFQSSRSVGTLLETSEVRESSGNVGSVGNNLRKPQKLWKVTW